MKAGQSSVLSCLRFLKKKTKCCYCPLIADQSSSPCRLPGVQKTLSPRRSRGRRRRSVPGGWFSESEGHCCGEWGVWVRRQQQHRREEKRHAQLQTMRSAGFPPGFCGFSLWSKVCWKIDVRMILVSKAFRILLDRIARLKCPQMTTSNQILWVSVVQQLCWKMHLTKVSFRRRLFICDTKCNVLKCFSSRGRHD